MHVSRFALIGSLLPLLLPYAAGAQAPAATRTLLSLSAPGTVGAGAAETLSAQVVDAGNNAIARGVVRFYDGTRLVGTAQIITNGSGPIGRAVIRTRFGAGSHALTAKFAGATNLGAPSQSVVQTLTVNGSTSGASQATITARPTYTAPYPAVVATVTTLGTSVPPSGNVQFLDTIGTPYAVPLPAEPLVPLSSQAGFAVSQLGSSTAVYATADFNNDGVPDVIAATGSIYASPLGLYLGVGNGTFQPPQPLLANTAYGTPQQVTVGDFNADGNTDIVLSGTNGVLLLGNGAGSFVLGASPKTNSYSTAFGDFDGDGNLDLAAPTLDSSGTYGIYVSFGKGDGTFAPPALVAPLTSFYGNLTVADLNGDGVDDLVIPSSENQPATRTDAYVVLGSAQRTFLPPAPVNQNVAGVLNTQAIGAGDFNNDGIVDLVIARYLRGKLYVNLGNGDGTFQPALTISTPDPSGPTGYGGYVGSLVVGDWDNNGKLDLAISVQGTNGTYLLSGKGDGTFSLASGTNPIGSVEDADVLLATDLNGDSNLDILAGGSIFLGSPSATSTATIYSAAIAGNYPHFVAGQYTPPFSQTVTSNAVGITGSDARNVNAIQGFVPDTGLHLNGSATLKGYALQLTDGGTYEAGSAWSNVPVNVRSFSTGFDFQITNPDADGFTFTIQNSAPTALGAPGGELGYNFIPNSVAAKFDLYNNSGEGANSVGFYSAGNTLTGPGSVLPADVDLKSGHPFTAVITYDGTTLRLNLRDQTTQATATYAKQMDLPALIGSDTAYVGFTGATGGLTSTVQILNWTYQPRVGAASIDASLHLNGAAQISGTTLQLTNLVQNQAASAWSATPVNITTFDTTFQFQITQPDADGFTFALQNGGPNALGSSGGELGFNFIPNSVAVKFDLYNNAGEGDSSTGVFPAGSTLTGPSIPVPAAFFKSGNVISAELKYDGTTLSLLLNDYTNNTGDRSFGYYKTVDLRGLLGSPNAYVGFTGATGGATSNIKILNWQYAPGLLVDGH